MSDWLLVDGNPKSSPRPRARGPVYMPTWYKHHQQDVRLQASSQINARDLDVYFGNEHLAFTSFFARNGGGDGDNMAKTITDALNNVAYEDDRQLLEWHFWLQRGIPKSKCGTWLNVQPTRNWPVSPPHDLNPCNFCVWQRRVT